jgi:hypothetical protein
MKLYITIGWGNHESPDGPDGEDTHFLVRAHDHVQAARLADEVLRLMPTACTDGYRSVQSFCHKVIEVGADSSACPDLLPQVLMGAWIAYGYAVHHDGYATWSRDSAEENAWGGAHGEL